VTRVSELSAPSSEISPGHSAVPSAVAACRRSTALQSSRVSWCSSRSSVTCVNTIRATALIPFDATGDPLALSTTLALLSTLVYAFGYVLSVAAELCHSLARRTRGGPPVGTLAIAAIALAMVFSVWMAARRAPRPCNAARC
jgi:hypothetical protein